jgi:hypothetical protein
MYIALCSQTRWSTSAAIHILNGKCVDWTDVAALRKVMVLRRTVQWSFVVLVEPYAFANIQNEKTPLGKLIRFS